MGKMAECKGVEVGLELEFLEESGVGQSLEVCQMTVSKQLSCLTLYCFLIYWFPPACLLPLLSSVLG